MKRILLHIGQSKTGTTALQRFFQSQRKALQAQGVLYPDVMLRGMPLDLESHNVVGDALGGLNRYPFLLPEEYFGQFFEGWKKSGTDRLLLSGESFFGGAPQPWDMKTGEDFFDLYEAKLHRLKSCLRGHECEVILYLRSQEEWLESAVPHLIGYQGLIAGMTQKTDEEIFALLKERMDYSRLVGCWERIVAPQSLHIIPYAPKKLRNKDIIADFLSRFDIGLEAPDVRKDDNKSLDRRIVWLKRTLNAVPKNKSRERLIIRAMTEINVLIPDHAKYALAHGLKASCRACYEDSNRTLVERYKIKDLFPKGESKPSAPISIEERFYILMLFERLYNSPRYRVLYLQMYVKDIVRSHLPALHAFIKRVYASFKVGQLKETA